MKMKEKKFFYFYEGYGKFIFERKIDRECVGNIVVANTEINGCWNLRHIVAPEERLKTGGKVYIVNVKSKVSFHLVMEYLGLGMNILGSIIVHILVNCGRRVIDRDINVWNVYVPHEVVSKVDIYRARYKCEAFLLEAK